MRKTIPRIAMFVTIMLLAFNSPLLAAGEVYMDASSGDYPYVQPGTPFSSGAHGVADMIRSAGAYNALTAEGAVKAGQAQQQFIENRRAAVENYFAVRDINRRSRGEERGPRASAEDMVRYSRSGAPARLSPGELDHVSGRIAWPVLLRDDQYVNYRAAIEQLFNRRAVNRQLSTREFLQLDGLIRSMTTELQSQVAKLPPLEYVRAKRFVQSLGHEVSFPPGLNWGEGLAAK
jgi:hypothetical protein